LKVDKATINDITRMHQLINHFADRHEMLPRSLAEMYENIRDYFVIRGADDQVIACVALHVCWSDLAEVKSLAVFEESQKKSVGAQLVQACLNEAKELGIPTVFCLTYKSGFFEKLGFTLIDKMELPQKVWNECFHCPKFPNCDEQALVYHLEV